MINDELFGNIEYDNLWLGKVNLKFWGEQKEYKIGFKGEKNGNFLESQRQAYKYLVEKTEQLEKQVEKALYNYYFEVVYKYYSDTVELPLAPSMAEIKNMVKVETFVVQKFRPADRIISIVFKCIWDDDEGFGVRIVNEEIKTVGCQGDVL